MSTKKIGLVLMCLALGACRDRRSNETKRADDFAQALDAYLAARGELCVGKTEWPIDVTAREALIGTRDAKQLPVLERLGLVRATDAVAQRKNDEQTVEVPVRRYELTPAGREYYHSHTTKNSQGELVTTSDLCAARLTLDHITKSELATGANAQQTAVLLYTYRVAPAPWSADPELRRVFPAVARVLQGAGKDELREEVTLTPEGWIANELVGSVRTPSPAASQASDG